MNADGTVRPGCLCDGCLDVMLANATTAPTVSRGIRPDHEQAIPVWVCPNCWDAMNGETVTDYDRLPLALLPGGWRIAPGLLWGVGAHSEECALTGCEHEQITYSREPCDGCGDPTCGGREAATMYLPNE